MNQLKIKYDVRQRQVTIIKSDSEEITNDTIDDIVAVQIMHDKTVIGLLTNGNITIVGEKIHYETEPFEQKLGKLLKVVVRE